MTKITSAFPRYGQRIFSDIKTNHVELTLVMHVMQRGLHIGLVERNDFSFGTFLRSSKLHSWGSPVTGKAVSNYDYGQPKLVLPAFEERKQAIENTSHLCYA